MIFDEQAVRFSCDGLDLYGIASVPASPAHRGVVILVGGPQYRVGSHRQFTLLSRDLAASGIPTFRFDYRGMGDSEGLIRTFEDVNEDLRAALDAFAEAVPTVTEFVIWGLCDAASAASFYAYRDPRVCGLVLINPWVRTEQGIAKTYLKHYYVRRLLAPEFWTKVVKGRFDYREAGRSLFENLGRVFSGNRQVDNSPLADKSAPPSPRPLPERMLDGLSKFTGRILVILSENDLTAQEFEEVAKSSARWRKRMEASSVLQRRLAGANHTFSRREWRDQVANWTREWLQSW